MATEVPGAALRSISRQRRRVSVFGCGSTKIVLIVDFFNFFLDDYDNRQNEVIKTEELTYNNHSQRVTFSHLIAIVSLVVATVVQMRFLLL
jgi:hypothetical protein